MFAGFEAKRLSVSGVETALVQGATGPGLLLLHGHPQTHPIWHKIANQLATRFTVVATDLRGYGDSSKPDGLPDHSNYAKRVMAQDQVDVMGALGFDRFYLVGHDRRGRVAYRLALDHPDRVRKLVTRDIAPTLAMYEQTTMEFARAYFHWFLLIQPAPFPERLTDGDPEFYIRSLMGGGSAVAPFTPDAYAECARCIRAPGTAHGICEDYRASASIDLEHKRTDLAAGRKLECDMLVLWDAHGAIEKCFRPLEEWRRLATRVQGGALPCGRYIPEEVPDMLLSELLAFLRD